MNAMAECMMLMGELKQAVKSLREDRDSLRAQLTAAEARAREAERERDLALKGVPEAALIHKARAEAAERERDLARDALVQVRLALDDAGASSSVPETHADRIAEVAEERNDLIETVARALDVLFPGRHPDDSYEDAEIVEAIEVLRKANEEWHDAAAKEATRAEAAESAASEAIHSLRNLLAVIHRDGGHYATEHGDTKAAKDAEALVLRNRQDRDDYKAAAQEEASAAAEARREAGALRALLHEASACLNDDERTRCSGCQQVSETEYDCPGHYARAEDWWRRVDAALEAYRRARGDSNQEKNP